MPNILVTGCGGDMGQSMGKLLRMEYADSTIIGCDITDKHAGHFIFSSCEIVPRMDAPGYVEAISALVAKFELHFLIPGSEQELRFFVDNNMTKVTGAHILIPDPKVITIGRNKLKTQEFLKEHGLPHAWTVLVGEDEPKEFPCIFKDNGGSGSRDLAKVTKENYGEYKNRGNQFIFQEYLQPDEEEYTCGLYRSSKGDVRSTIFRRTLLYGSTNYGECVHNEDITKLLNELAEKLQLVGSINVQLRLTERGPVVFEINPRFSSTVLFRHMLGYKDVIWSIEDHQGSEPSSYTDIEAGTKIYKGWQEFSVDNNGEVQTINPLSLQMEKVSK